MADARAESSDSVSALGPTELGTRQTEAAARQPSAHGFEWEDGIGRGLYTRRDQLLRRSLLLADLTAFLGAFAVLGLAFSRSLRLGWLSLAGLLALFLVAKVIGLYDRDEALLHKTTLDEAPKLFTVATLGALCGWLAGGFVLAGGDFDRPAVLAFWLSLWIFLILARAAMRAITLRISSPERCMFVGDPNTAETIKSKLADQHGLKAELVASIDPADITAWATDAFSTPQLPEIRGLAQSLDVQRAIVAPDSLRPESMLDLICTLEAVGVQGQRAAAPARGRRLLGRVRRPRTASPCWASAASASAAPRRAVKRGFDVIGALLGLLAMAPLMIAIAIAIKLDTQGPVFFRQRAGRHATASTSRSSSSARWSPTPSAEGRRCADRNEAAAGSSRSPTTRASPGSAASCARPRSTSCRSCSTCSRAR